MFYSVVITDGFDTAAYNAFLLYCARHPEFKDKYKLRARREFIKILTDSLLLEKTNYNMEPAKKKKETDTVRKWCQLCSRQERKKTTNKFDVCLKMVCSEHRTTQTVCANCQI